MNVKERPILFSGPMVRAILDGRKTQTRRVVKAPIPKFQLVPKACPYGIPGDRLWVRETWSDAWKLPKPLKPMIEYRADWNVEDDELGGRKFAWKPSIFMRRQESRITLEITGVHLEQLQDIKESGAKSEGAPMWVPGHGEVTASDVNADPGYANFISYRLGFEMLWDSINKKRGFGWETNPLVWVITFRCSPC